MVTYSISKTNIKNEESVWSVRINADTWEGTEDAWANFSRVKRVILSEYERVITRAYHEYQRRKKVNTDYYEVVDSYDGLHRRRAYNCDGEYIGYYRHKKKRRSKRNGSRR